MTPSPAADLLTFLKNLPPSTLYNLAPKLSLMRGWDAYRHGRLAGYQWSADRSTLTAMVLDQRINRVTCAVEEDAFTFSCDCREWAPERACPHVVCAFLATTNLLKPEIFSFPNAPAANRDAMRTALLAGHPADIPPSVSVSEGAGIEIVIQSHDAYPSVSVRKNGRPITPTGRIPFELAGLVSHSGYRTDIPRHALPHYLARYGNLHPIMLETADGAFPLTWKPGIEAHAKTQLDVKGDRVEVRALCSIHGQLKARMIPLPGLIVDLEAQAIGPLEDHHTIGWNLYRALEGLFLPGMSVLREQDNLPEAPGHARMATTLRLPVETGWGSSWTWRSRRTSFDVPLQDFQSVQISLAGRDADRAFEDVVLTIAGVETAERPDDARTTSETRFRLTIEPSSDAEEQAVPMCLLRADGLYGNINWAPTASVFGLFPYLRSRSIAAPLRAQKRQIAMTQAFFDALPARTTTERDRIIKTACSGEDFRRYRLISAASQIVAHFASEFAMPERRLVGDPTGWRLAPVDKAREASLYRILFEVFGPHPFLRMHRHDELALPAAALHDRLGELYARLSEAGIALYYKGKPVIPSKWEFAIDARTATGIDWFELQPEIRCDGVLVENVSVDDLFRSGGLVETDQGARILDANAQHILHSLAALSTSASAKPGAKEIVRIPRLQILDWIVLREKGLTLTLRPDDEALMERLLRFEKIEPPPLPKRLKASLRPYQRHGYAWLAFLYRHRFGACLADDMGLGKTIQAISLLAGVKEGLIPPPLPARAPHLIVAPPSLLFNWEQELERFYPALRVRAYSGKDRRPAFDDCDVVLTTYGLVRRDIAHLATVPFHIIVFDEAQAVKNIHADTTGAVRRLKSAFTLVMTGTPLENHLGEYYSLLDLALPGLLGDYARFKPLLKLDRSPSLDRLLRRTKPFVLRRTKEQVLKDLPPKTETDVCLDLTDHQKALYHRTVTAVRSTIDQAYHRKTATQAQIIALSAILKLRQICLSPALLTKQSEDSSPKITFLLDQLRELRDEGHSALVFSQFTSFLDLVEEVLAGAGLPSIRLDGQTPTAKRKDLVRRFQSAEAPSIFLLSLKAGGQGLNLTQATYVYLLDPWWNPAVEQQAADRAHRIGQKRAVTIVRILMRHTIEEKMVALKQKKRALYDAVMDNAGAGAKGPLLSKADFEFLLAGW